MRYICIYSSPTTLDNIILLGASINLISPRPGSFLSKSMSVSSNVEISTGKTANRFVQHDFDELLSFLYYALLSVVVCHVESEKTQQTSVRAFGVGLLLCVTL